MEVNEPYVLSEIGNSLIFSLAANKKYTCLTEETKLLFINSVSHESWNIMDVGESIKGLRLPLKGNLISVATSSKILFIIDLQMKVILHKFENFFSIEHFKWHTENENCFFMVRNENSLEKWVGSDTEFTLSSINIPSLMYFEIIPDNDTQLVVLTLEGELKIVNMKEKSENLIGKVGIVDLGPISCLDSDLLCLQTPTELRFYSISSKFPMFVVQKTIFRYDFENQYLMFSDFMSKNATLVTKENFLSHRLEGDKYEISLLENPLEIEFVPKGILGNYFDVLVRHNNRVYLYSLNFKQYRQVDLMPNPEKYEDIYVFSKDSVNFIMDSLTKRFDELMKKLDKSLAMAGTLQNINRSVQCSIEKKFEEISLNTTSALYSSLIQNFKTEILSSLVAQLESDLKDILHKFSYFFQDRLKMKVERNNREEEKSKKIAAHMKNCVVGFTNMEDHIRRTLKKKTKVLCDFEIRSLENQEKIEVREEGMNELLFNLKVEVDSLLQQKKFETAICRALQENRFEIVYGVLGVINPKPLIYSHCIGSKTAIKLFTFLLQNIEKAQRYQELYVWLEELVKGISCSDIRIILPKIIEASFAYPQLSSLAKLCTKKLEENYKLEN